MNESKIAKKRRPPQISLALMMLMMVVFAIISAGLFYAARVPAVQSDINSLFGGDANGAEDVGRNAQLTFIMFTFASPLILAGLLSSGMAVLEWFQRRPE
jgi:hypothetical protein